MKTEDKPLRTLLLGLYAAALGLLLFARRSVGSPGVNWRLLGSIRSYCLVLRRSDPAGLALRPYAAANFFGNVLLFAPLGLLLPGLFPRLRRLGRLAPLAAALSLAAEGLQYLTATGSLDVDDVLLNTLGAALGWGLWRLLRRGHGN